MLGGWDLCVDIASRMRSYPLGYLRKVPSQLRSFDSTAVLTVVPLRIASVNDSKSLRFPCWVGQPLMSPYSSQCSGQVCSPAQSSHVLGPWKSGSAESFLMQYSRFCVAFPLAGMKCGAPDSTPEMGLVQINFLMRR